MLFRNKNSNSSFSIRIENPCHEKWDEMSQQDKGRFCGACSKVVVDFNSMTDSQIVELISNSSRSVCGRISKTRMQTKFYTTNHNTSPFNFQLLKYSLAGFLTFLSVKGLAQNPGIKKQIVRDDSGVKNKKKTDEKPVKKGGVLMINVRAKEGNLPRSGSTITLSCGTWQKVIKGTSARVTLPDSLMTQSLVIDIYSPGYEYKSEIVDLKKNGVRHLVFDLEKQEEMLMGVIVPYND